MRSNMMQEKERCRDMRVSLSERYRDRDPRIAAQPISGQSSLAPSIGLVSNATQRRYNYLDASVHSTIVPCLKLSELHHTLSVLFGRTSSTIHNLQRPFNHRAPLRRQNVTQSRHLRMRDILQPRQFVLGQFHHRGLQRRSRHRGSARERARVRLSLQPARSHRGRRRVNGSDGGDRRGVSRSRRAIAHAAAAGKDSGAQ